MRLGEVAVEGEDGVFDPAVERVVQRLDVAGARGDGAEGRVQLRQIGGLDDELELAERRGPQPQLAPQQPPAGDQPTALQVPYVRFERAHDLKIGSPFPQVEPALIDVHALLPEDCGTRAIAPSIRRAGLDDLPGAIE